jgi:tetratricopeptide (TPR) repeat protein
MASLPGFTSELVPLSQRVSFSENNNVGRIVLHRMGDVTGFTLSATSAAAPPKARKDFEKGLDQAKKGHLDVAGEFFQKAVDVYPKYAAAWCELGRVRKTQQDIAGAYQALRRSTDADSQFLSPQLLLVQLEAHDRKWEELLDSSTKALSLDPVSFPQLWLYNATANYSLTKLSAAEQSARQGLKLDPSHHLPQFEYLLGLILIRKSEIQEGAEHIRAYLQLAPDAPDAAQARAELAQVQRRLAVAGSSPQPGEPPR